MYCSIYPLECFILLKLNLIGCFMPSHQPFTYQIHIFHKLKYTNNIHLRIINAILNKIKYIKNNILKYLYY